LRHHGTSARDFTGIKSAEVGKVFKVLIDRKEGGEFIGRTEFDSPEVDNEVILPSASYLRMGDFVHAKIVAATEFDLTGEPIV